MPSPPDLRRIVDVAPLVKSGAVSPVALVQSCHEQIEARPELNAFITRLDADAIADARDRDADVRAGRYRGPLHGIPIAVKDLIDVKGTKTTAGSAVPVDEATADAPSIASLRAAGAIIIGKANLHEFAFGTTSEESAFGPVRNPLDPTRSAGGSSGGSAAALAAGMCFGALGTDTGGSIRIPSAACGTVGLKPTLGELSCEGVTPLSTSFDHLGPMTRSVADAALLFDVLKGRESRDLVPAQGPLTFGVPQAYFADRLERGVKRALDLAGEALTRAGHVVRNVDVQHAAATPDVYLHVVLPEASHYHAARLERFADRYSPGVRTRLEMGRYLLAEDYVRALRLRDVLRASVDRALDGCDALLVPALAIPAPILGSTMVDVNGAAEPIRGAMLRLTQLFNMTGHPSIAIPAAHDVDRLPRGVQIVGQMNQTWRLLEIAAAIDSIIAPDERGRAHAC